jgi:epsilon-lactone hydrolase
MRIFGTKARTTHLSRRKALQGTAGLAAAATLGFPAILRAQDVIKNSVNVHPLDPGDAPITAAIRSAASSAKGAPAGPEARAQFDAFMESVVPRDDVAVEIETLGGIPGLWVKPVSARSGEAILHLHGGWFNFGSAKAYRHLVGHIAARAGAKAFIPDYRLAPEHLFPRPRTTCWHATRALPRWARTGSHLRETQLGAISPWVSPRELPAHRTACRSWALLCCRRLRTSLFPVQPMRRAQMRILFFTHPQVAALVRSYLGSADPNDPLASPLVAKVAGMPPVRIHVGDDEVLLDDSRRYVERAVAAGVDARLDVWMGMPHGFPASVGKLKAAGQSLDAVGAFLTQRLQGKVGR